MIIIVKLDDHSNFGQAEAEELWKCSQAASETGVKETMPRQAARECQR